MSSQHFYLPWRFLGFKCIDELSPPEEFDQRDWDVIELEKIEALDQVRSYIGEADAGVMGRVMFSFQGR